MALATRGGASHDIAAVAVLCIPVTRGEARYTVLGVPRKALHGSSCSSLGGGGLRHCSE
jgi:hypothetical protein